MNDRNYTLFGFAFIIAVLLFNIVDAVLRGSLIGTLLNAALLLPCMVSAYAFTQENT